MKPEKFGPLLRSFLRQKTLSAIRSCSERRRANWRWYPRGGCHVLRRGRIYRCPGTAVLDRLRPSFADCHPFIGRSRAKLSLVHTTEEFSKKSANLSPAAASVLYVTLLVHVFALNLPKMGSTAMSLAGTWCKIHVLRCSCWGVNL